MSEYDYEFKTYRCGDEFEIPNTPACEQCNRFFLQNPPEALKERLCPNCRQGEQGTLI